MALVQNIIATRETFGLEPVSAKRESYFRRHELWFWGALILAIIVDVLYIKAFAVDVVWLDEWGFTPYLQQFNEGRLDYLQFLTWQHNEHRLFFPLMVLFSVARLTHYDGRAVQYAGLAIMGLSALAVLLLARKRLLSVPFGTLYLGAIAAFMVSLRQWENLINGFSCSILAGSFFFVLSVCFLDKVGKFNWRVCLAVASAFCATFSYANGLLCWPLGLFMLLGNRALSEVKSQQAMLTPLLVWLAASVAVPVYYFGSYHGMKNGSLGSILRLCAPGQLFETLKMFFVSLANSLCFEPYGATGTGLAIFLIIVFVSVNVLRGTWRLTQDSIAPLALLLFGLLSTAMIFIGRAPDGGLAALLTSRYACVTSLAIVGLLIFISTLKTSDTLKKVAINSGLTFAIFVSIVSSGLFALPMGKEVKNERLVAAQIMKNYKNESDERLNVLMPFPKVLRVYAPYLEQQKYSVFRRP